MTSSIRYLFFGIAVSCFTSLALLDDVSGAEILTDFATGGSEYVIGIDDLVVGDTVMDVRFRFGTYGSLTGGGLELLALAGDEDSALAVRSRIINLLNARVPRLGTVGEPGATGFGLGADKHFNSFAVAYETEGGSFAGRASSSGTFGWVGSTVVDIESSNNFLTTFVNVRPVVVLKDGFE